MLHTDTGIATSFPDNEREPHTQASAGGGRADRTDAHWSEDAPLGPVLEAGLRVPSLGEERGERRKDFCLHPVGDKMGNRTRMEEIPGESNLEKI